jgi:hypothetical protein
VELWPYAQRSRGIAAFQLFSRLAAFFTTFVNPIGLSNASWKYLMSYCVFLAFEVAFVYWMFPETFGRTLEELTFCESRLIDTLAFLIRQQCSKIRSLLNKLTWLLRKLAMLLSWKQLQRRPTLSRKKVLSRRRALCESLELLVIRGTSSSAPMIELLKLKRRTYGIHRG